MAKMYYPSRGLGGKRDYEANWVEIMICVCYYVHFVKFTGKEEGMLILSFSKTFVIYSH